MIKCEITRDDLRKSSYENVKKNPVNDECNNDKELSESIKELSKVFAMMWTGKQK